MAAGHTEDTQRSVLTRSIDRPSRKRHGQNVGRPGDGDIRRKSLDDRLPAGARGSAPEVARNTDDPWGGQTWTSDRRS